jgi:hypothetical protein
MAFPLFIAAALLALASFALARNQANRGFIDDQRRSAVSPGQRAVSVPEQQLRYDADDLNAFKNLLGTQTRPAFENALRFYLRPTLIWNDIIFAIVSGVTGKGIFANTKEFYPRPLVLGLVALLVVANTINIAADIVAMGEALYLERFPTELNRGFPIVCE